MATIDWAAYMNTYAQAIDLDLMNATLDLAACTSDVPNAAHGYRSMVRKILLGDSGADYEKYFQPYNLRYLGEVLERYEEKLGASQEQFRAVALALGYATPFLSPNMFVGRQKEDFLAKLDQAAGEDVYLRSAQYLIATDEREKSDLLSALTSREYKNTEEAMFVLSLFGEDNAAQGFEAMRPQLARLWGKERTIDLTVNIGILDWFLYHFRDEVKACRKKDNTILRNLTKLALQFVREDKPEYKALRECGYSDLEIRYANSWLSWRGRGKNMRPDGIPGEKAAAEFCISCLNRREDVPDTLLGYTHEVMTWQRDFNVKYEGNTGIWPAIKSRLVPVRPQAVLWMIQHVEHEFPYRFDVFDPQWDVLARELSKTIYRRSFTMQMLDKPELTPEDTARWLARYTEVTGCDYMEYFSESRYEGNDAFTFLMERDAIDLWAFFETHTHDQENERDPGSCLYHIRQCVMFIPSHRAFDFVKRLMETYTIRDLRRFFGQDLYFHEPFLSERLRYHHGAVHLKLKKEFLSSEEKRQLFEWIDQSVFETEPEVYQEFVSIALQDDTVREIYSMEELRPILDALLQTGSLKDWVATSLKKIYYTQEELEVEHQARARAKEEAEREAQRKAAEQKRDEMEESFDGSFVSLLEFVTDYYGRERTNAVEMAFPIMGEMLSQMGITPEAEELFAFFELCAYMTKCENIPKTGLLTLVENMVKGVKDHVTNS